jgi:hypothetical protein
MKFLSLKRNLALVTLFIPLMMMAQDFQGKAYYFSKSTLELGSFGATMSEA